MAAETPTIACVLKLRPTCAQAAVMERWLWHLTSVYNWTVKTIEHEAEAGRYPSKFDIYNRLLGHGDKIGVAASAIKGTANTVHEAWSRCFRGLAQKPRLKGRRRSLNSIALAHRLYPIKNGRVAIPIIGRVRYHRQDVPNGHIGCARIIRRASGWYVCLFIQAPPKPIDRVGLGEIGIDPGFQSLLTLSTGEKLEHPRELATGEKRLAQAQRGHRTRLTARLHERIGNRRLNRNHHLSRRLVSENVLIAFSKDRLRGIARSFGKSVSSASHGQIRTMLKRKSLAGGAQFIEVDSRNSTKRCSSCGSLTGPTGLSRLRVRQWTCSACGAVHDRDRNAAINTLIAGRGARHENGCEAVSGIAQ